MFCIMLALFFNIASVIFTGENLTISDVLGSEPGLRSLLDKSLKLSPELITAILNARVNISQVISVP